MLKWHLSSSSPSMKNHIPFERFRYAFGRMAISVSAMSTLEFWVLFLERCFQLYDPNYNRKQQKHKCPRILQLFRAVFCDMATDDDAVWWSNFVSQGRQNRVLWLSPTLSPSPISYSWLKPFFFLESQQKELSGQSHQNMQDDLPRSTGTRMPNIHGLPGRRTVPADRLHCTCCALLGVRWSLFKRRRDATPWEGGTRLRTRMEIKWLRVSHFIPMSTVLLHSHASSNAASGPLLAPRAGKDPSPDFYRPAAIWAVVVKCSYRMGVLLALGRKHGSPAALPRKPLCFPSSHFKCKISLRDSHRKGTLIYLLLILWNCNRNWFGILYPILMKLDFFKKILPRLNISKITSWAK